MTAHVYCPGTGQPAKRITRQGKLWGRRTGVFEHHRGICPVCENEVAVFYYAKTCFSHSAEGRGRLIWV